MKKSTRNDGISIINAPDKKFERATIVVLGLGRSGTSLVSQILINTGVFMGDVTNATGEDRKIADFVDNQKFEMLGRLIVERSQKYEYWGWKRPNTLNYISKIDKLIENPVYVCVFRDVLAISKRNEVSMGRDVKEGLGHALRSYGRLIDFISKTNKTCILSSFEKLKTSHGSLIDSLNTVLENELNYTQSMETNVKKMKSQYMVDSFGLTE